MSTVRTLEAILDVCGTGLAMEGVNANPPQE
jgi:hypothetical protein